MTVHKLAILVLAAVLPSASLAGSAERERREQIRRLVSDFQSAMEQLDDVADRTENQVDDVRSYYREYIEDFRGRGLDGYDGLRPYVGAYKEHYESLRAARRASEVEHEGLRELQRRQSAAARGDERRELPSYEDMCRAGHDQPIIEATRQIRERAARGAAAHPRNGAAIHAAKSAFSLEYHADQSAVTALRETMAVRALTQNGVIGVVHLQTVCSGRRNNDDCSSWRWQLVARQGETDDYAGELSQVPASITVGDKTFPVVVSYR